jgi:hypothetical protein
VSEPTTKPHWLAPSRTSSSPDLVLCFDTETTEAYSPGHSSLTLRCWDAKVRQRHQRHAKPDVIRYHRGERASQFTDLVEATSELEAELWVIAHNVSFDLAVTSLPFALVSRGWLLDGVYLGDESTWWVLKRDRHTIVITDSWSWVRCSLGEAAKDIRRRKISLPNAADTLEEWHHRCRVDVDILDRLMNELMQWWDANDLGKFGITGAACGWRALRKVIRPKSILVGPEQPRTDFERAAIFGGLKEVYGVGQFYDTWIADYDFVAAYVTTAAAFPLPVMPAKRWSTSERLLDSAPPPGRDYIAEVEITTRRPCAPVRIDDEIWSPVGTFRTTLAGPEVRYAMSVADSVHVLRHEAYRTGFALADWAAWCLELMAPVNGPVSPVVARVAKNWGRSVIGRFASRTSRVIDVRPSTHLGWHLETGHDLDTGRVLEFLSIGGVQQTIAKELDGPDCFPAVLAFVESHTRVALRQMIDSRDPTSVLQCNTDGWWEMKATRRSDYTPPNVPYPYRVVRKALERSLLVRGPNHVLTPHERRYAGVPSEAIEKDDGKLHWQDWPGLKWQLENGTVGEYHRPDAEGELAEHYVKRWVLTTGETVPVTTRFDAQHTTVLEPWCRSWGHRANDVLAPYQVPTLLALNESDREIAEGELPSLHDIPGRDFPSPPRGAQRPEPVSEEFVTTPHIPHPRPSLPLG